MPRSDLSVRFSELQLRPSCLLRTVLYHLDNDQITLSPSATYVVDLDGPYTIRRPVGDDAGWKRVTPGLVVNAPAARRGTRTKEPAGLRPMSSQGGLEAVLWGCTLLVVDSYIQADRSESQMPAGGFVAPSMQGVPSSQLGVHIRHAPHCVPD